MNVDIRKPEAAAGVLLALLGGSHQERIRIGSEFAGGYRVEQTWTSPVGFAEGVDTILVDLFALASVAVGIAALLAFGRDGFGRVRSWLDDGGDDEPLPDDNRGSISFHIVVFFASLVLGGVLWILLEPLAEEMLFLASEQTTTKAAGQGQQYVHYTMSSLHLIIIGLGMLQLLAAVVYQGRVRR